MFLLYADDSGSVPDSSQAYFALSGFSVFERKGYWIAQELDKIAARFNPSDPASVELHGSPMLNGSGIWRKFPLPDRVRAMKEALQLVVTAKPSVAVFCVAINKVSASPRDPVEVAFEQLASRFDQYLRRKYLANDPQRGMMILDKSTSETALQRLATDFRTVGHTWGKLQNFAEVPVFLDSRASRLIQLADLLAYGTFRKFERGDEQFFEVFESALDASGGVVHGLYHLA